MKTIKISINDELLDQTSIELLESYLQEQLQFLRLKILSHDIKNAVLDFDLEKEMKEAKKSAWEEYKHKYLTGII